MTTIQLQYFLTAAQTCNFTVAAERMFTTQPALSRQIAALEAELDVQLFTRTNNVLELTEVGRFFYQRASLLHQSYQELVKETQERSAGIEGRVRIGLLEDQLIDPKLTRAIHVLLRAHPRASIDIGRHNYCDLIEKLDQGALDLCQTTIYEGIPTQHYHQLPLSAEPIHLAVNQNYIPVERAAIQHHEVAQIVGGFPIVLASLSTYPEIIRGYLPQIPLENVRFVDSLSSISLYLTTGIAASIVNKRNLVCIDPNVRLIPIADVPPVTQGIVWCSSNTNPILHQLLARIAEETRDAI